MRTWSPEEDELISMLLGTVGHRWSEMVPSFPGRTAAQIRNRHLRCTRGRLQTAAGYSKNRCRLCGLIKSGHRCARAIELRESLSDENPHIESDDESRRKSTDSVDDDPRVDAAAVRCPIPDEPPLDKKAIRSKRSASKALGPTTIGLPAPKRGNLKASTTPHSDPVLGVFINGIDYPDE